MGIKMSKKGNWKWKLQQYAIPNLSLYLIICYGIGYVMQMLPYPITDLLVLDPFLILRGQVWRLVTWIFIPPERSNLFFVLIMLYLYYSLGNLLEQIWGTYKFNVFMFSGMLFTILGSFVLWLYCLVVGAQPVELGGYLFYWLENGDVVSFAQFSTYYINMSIFLACAASIPNVRVMLMFIFPIKIKWLGIIYGVILLFNCIEGGFVTWVVVLFSLLNFLVFFIRSKGKMKLNPGQIKTRHDFRRKMRVAEHEIRATTKHKCAICGKTEKDDDRLEFRFCSKCQGNYEYCQDHLFTHEHKK